MSEEGKPEGFDTAPVRRLDSEEDASVKIGFGITRANRTHFLLILPPSDPTVIDGAFHTFEASCRLVDYWEAFDQAEHYALVSVRNPSDIGPLAEVLKAHKVTRLKRGAVFTGL